VSSLAADYGLTRAAAAAALAFIVLVTPAAITDFIADSTGIQVRPLPTALSWDMCIA
jgi:hypothetical protein